MPTESGKPLIVISYAHADEPEKPAEGEVKWLSFVTGYLRPAIKHGAVDLWIDRLLPGGADWEREIEQKFRACDIFILLVSPNSLSSDYVVDKEIAIIRERQKRGEEVHFYPLVLTPTPNIALDRVRDKNLRPRDGKPLSDYPLNERYRHMVEAANEIGKIATAIAAKEIGQTSPVRPEAGSRARAGKLALTNIAIAVPLHFLGRDDTLQKIDAALNSDPGRGAIASLHGLRGVGKTTVAAAYAERHRGDYRATWWIRAQTPDTLRAGLVSLGVSLGWVAADEKGEPALEAVRWRLRDDGEGLLLIYDNATDLESLRPYLPLGGLARIIITSNADDWRKIAVAIEVRAWPQAVGANYLVARTEGGAERKEAEALSGTLGGLPLAHEQAAAYCERLHVSLAAYRTRFEAAPGRLLDGDKYAPAEYHDGLTVAKAFLLAIDEAAKLHPAAEPLICYSALLAPEPIPLFLFSEAREKFAEPLASQLAGDGLDEAIGALRVFALVERETIADERNPSTTTETIRLHRLVRIAAGERRQGKAAEEARRLLIEAMAEVYPTRAHDDPSVWPRARWLYPLAVGLVAGREPPLPKGAEAAASDILARLGSYRGALADYAVAQPFFERALEIREAAFGPEHPLTAKSFTDLAFLHKDKGLDASARQLLERALEICKKACGPESSETATSLTNLAILLKDKGDLPNARPLFEQALAIRETALGPEHPLTATSLTDLAFAVKDQGDLPGARELFNQALEIRKKAFGPEHPETATSLTNLAYLLKDQHEFDGARQFFERALEIRKKALGPEHPDTATSLDNLAFLRQGLGDLAGARPLYERALAIREKAFGPDHPNTSMSRNSLTYLLQASRDADGSRVATSPLPGSSR